MLPQLQTRSKNETNYPRLQLEALGEKAFTAGQLSCLANEEPSEGVGIKTARKNHFHSNAILFWLRLLVVRIFFSPSCGQTVTFS